MSEWIKVSDRLPEKSKSVLVYGYLGSAPQICTAIFEKHDGKFKTDHFCEMSYVTDVSHWMPLPKRPEIDNA